MSRFPTILKVLLISFFVLLSISQAESVSAGTDIWTPIGPEGGTINALVVDPATPSTMYAGTEGGGVFRSFSGGGTWSAINVGLTSPLVRALAIDPVTPTTVYAGTSSGVFRSTNGGANWTAFDSGLIRSEVRALAIDPVTPATVYAGTEGGGVFKIQQVEYSCDGVSEIPQAECEALVSLYNSTDGLSWTHNDGWLATGTPCSWYGVTCEAGHVQEIDLNTNGLIGTIPHELGNLSSLRKLYLGVSGAIEVDPTVTGLSKIANLQTPSLDRNKLSGAIPRELGSLAHLEILALGYNQLSGAIPPELGNLTHLRELMLDGNQLSDAIPHQLGNLANLEVIDLSHNLLSGPIPVALGGLTKLRVLSLYGNQLTGAIPPGLGNLVNLQYLVLSNNKLSGAIPPQLGALGNLEWLCLGYNRLSGTIPPELGDLDNLYQLCLSDNPLSGPLPPSLMKLDLSYFFYDNTGLCEPPDAAFQAWLAGIPGLERTGVICSYVYLPMVFNLSASDSFWADRDRLEPGECTTLHWSVPLAGTLAVFLDNEGVPAQAATQVCPTATHTYVLRVVRESGTQEYRLTITVEPPALSPIILVDDFVPQPLQGQPVYPYNRLGGDRGVINGAELTWGHGQVTTTVSAGNSWGGAWVSLNHPIREGLPINFSAILPAQILPEYQSRIWGGSFEIAAGTPGRLFKLELKEGDELRWKHEIILPGGSVAVIFELPPLGNINHLAWVLDRAAAGESVVLDDIRLGATTNITDTATAAFVWSYGQLLSNWNPATGLVRDKATDASGEFDAVQATGSLAAATAVAEQLGIVSHADAVQIVNKIGDTLLRNLPRSHGLWPHLVKVSPAGEIAIVPGAEWPSLDTAIAALGLLTAQVGLDLDTTATEQMLRDIDWSSLVTPGGISHGYTASGALIPYAWDTFGGESWLVALAYAAATGQVAPMAYPSPPTANGSGYVDELAWLFVPPPSRPDYWGTDWAAYRSAAADKQIGYYPSRPPGSCFGTFGLFGLSAGEVPDPSQVAPQNVYQAFGVDGRFAPPNDGSALLGAPVVVPHYTAMIASLRPKQATAMWTWLIEGGFFSPLNNVESLMFPAGSYCWRTEAVWNHLKGSWNLSLQTLGWGRYLAEQRGQEPILWQATTTDPFLRDGYCVLALCGSAPTSWSMARE